MSQDSANRRYPLDDLPGYRARHVWLPTSEKSSGVARCAGGVTPSRERLASAGRLRRAGGQVGDRWFDAAQVRPAD